MQLIPWNLGSDRIACEIECEIVPGDAPDIVLGRGWNFKERREMNAAEYAVMWSEKDEIIDRALSGSESEEPDYEAVREYVRNMREEKALAAPSPCRAAVFEMVGG